MLICNHASPSDALKVRLWPSFTLTSVTCGGVRLDGLKVFVCTINNYIQVHIHAHRVTTLVLSSPGQQREALYLLRVVAFGQSSSQRVFILTPRHLLVKVISASSTHLDTIQSIRVPASYSGHERHRDT
jgi:hypothetical protein